MERIEATVGFVKDMVTNGPIAAWEFLTDKIGDLKDIVFGAIKGFVVTALYYGNGKIRHRPINSIGAIDKPSRRDC